MFDKGLKKDILGIQTLYKNNRITDEQALLMIKNAGRLHMKNMKNKLHRKPAISLFWKGKKRFGKRDFWKNKFQIFERSNLKDLTYIWKNKERKAWKNLKQKKQEKLFAVYEGKEKAK